MVYSEKLRAYRFKCIYGFYPVKKCFEFGLLIWLSLTKRFKRVELEYSLDSWNIFLKAVKFQSQREWIQFFHNQERLKYADVNNISLQYIKFAFVLSFQKIFYLLISRKKNYVSMNIHLILKLRYCIACIYFALSTFSLCRIH